MIEITAEIRALIDKAAVGVEAGIVSCRTRPCAS